MKKTITQKHLHEALEKINSTERTRIPRLTKKVTETRTHPDQELKYTLNNHYDLKKYIQ